MWKQHTVMTLLSLRKSESRQGPHWLASQSQWVTPQRMTPSVAGGGPLPNSCLTLSPIVRQIVTKHKTTPHWTGSLSSYLPPPQHDSSTVLDTDSKNSGITHKNRNDEMEIPKERKKNESHKNEKYLWTYFCEWLRICVVVIGVFAQTRWHRVRLVLTLLQRSKTEQAIMPLTKFYQHVGNNFPRCSVDIWMVHNMSIKRLLTVRAWYQMLDYNEHISPEMEDCSGD